ncbi:MAG: choice-of-anchor Q domain-containing protein, partial [Limisphaerales bacterium]
MKICLATLALVAGLHFTASATIFVVNSPNDPGDGIITPSETTLREAINAATNGDIIRINPGLNISLNAGQLEITNDNITIEGPGPNLVTVDGRGVSRVFNIDGAAGIHISGLTVTGGNADLGGGIAVEVRVTSPIIHLLSGELFLSNAVVSANHATREGGGIFVDGDLTVFAPLIGKLHMSDCSILDNTAAVGGGLANRGFVDAVRCFFSDNFATNQAGAYYTQGTGFAEVQSFVPLNAISRTTFANNSTAGNGGAFATFNAGVALENVTISGNSAKGSGGGLYTFSDFPPKNYSSTFNDVTVTGNIADADHNNSGDGGGVFNGKTNTFVAVQNTIIAGNTDTGPTNAPDFFGVLTSLDYNLIGNTSGMTFSGPTAQTLINVNPLLGPLALNGFTIPTHALLAGSPAIDTANPATSLPIDERGVTRPQGAGPDMGAYERVVVTPPVIKSITATPDVLWPPNP